MDDYLRFYHEDIDTLRKYYPALISAYEGLIDRGNPLETGAYPLFLFCNPQLEPSIIARVKNSGAVISMENREPHNITFNDLSNLQEKIRHSELKPLKDRLNTIYNALTFINCYDIFVDLVCKTFRINNIKDFAKVTIKDYTALS